MKRVLGIHFACVCMLLLSGCAMTPKTFMRTYDEPGIWKTIELRDGLSQDEAWRLVVDTLSQKYDLEVVQKDSGYLRTSWQYTYVTPMGNVSQQYRSRIVVKLLGEKWEQIQVKCESNWLQGGGCFSGGGGWIVGYDTRILEDVYGDLQGKIGRVRR